MRRRLILLGLAGAAMGQAQFGPSAPEKPPTYRELVQAVHDLNRRTPLVYDLASLSPRNIRQVNPRMLGGWGFLWRAQGDSAMVMVGVSGRKDGFRVNSILGQHPVSEQQGRVRIREAQFWELAEKAFGDQIKDYKLRRGRIIVPGGLRGQKAEGEVPAGLVVEAYYEASHPRWPVEWGNRLAAGFRAGDGALVRAELVSTVKLEEPKRIITKDQARSALLHELGPGAYTDEWRLAFRADPSARLPQEKNRSRLFWIGAIPQGQYQSSSTEHQIDAETGRLVRAPAPTPPSRLEIDPVPPPPVQDEQAEMSRIGLITAGIMGAAAVLWMLFQRRS